MGLAVLSIRPMRSGVGNLSLKAVLQHQFMRLETSRLLSFVAAGNTAPTCDETALAQRANQAPTADDQ